MLSSILQQTHPHCIQESQRRVLASKLYIDYPLERGFAQLGGAGFSWGLRPAFGCYAKDLVTTQTAWQLREVPTWRLRKFFIDVILKRDPKVAGLVVEAVLGFPTDAGLLNERCCQRAPLAMAPKESMLLGLYAFSVSVEHGEKRLCAVSEVCSKKHPNIYIQKEHERVYSLLGGLEVI